ncbi:MAG: PKD domain-containing protein [Sphingobacteriales bacterium JAD_PAG50586_3]|nr:MAG: PKD domain-containing protein [Sphingobacteriales bacterium JAD_PAG50586_3]
MKILYTITAILLLITAPFAKAQTLCNSNGNLMLYTNYDGGIININVDVNIPNLKIGICTYEPVQVTISGAFAGNVTQVLYAGFNSTQNNNNCNQGNFITSITGVPNNIATIQTYPPANYPSANGWPFIICAYACDTIGNQGGCNTVDQVVAYFTQQTGGTLYAHNIQYNCWLNSTYNVSAGGTCCILPQSNDAPVAAFAADTTGGCAGSCLAFTNNSSGGPFTSVQWTFTGASPSSSTDENPTNICYPNSGTFPVELTVTNGNGTNTSTQSSFITIANPIPVANFTFTQIDNYTTNFTNTSTGGTTYLWQFPGNVTSTDANPVFNFPSDGNYPVTLIAYGPCGSDTLSIIVEVIKMPTSIGEIELKGFSIYPNPGNQLLNISLPEATANITVELIDPLGKVVATYNNLQGPNLQLNCNTLAAGAYLVSIKANGKQGKKVWVKL